MVGQEGFLAQKQVPLLRDQGKLLGVLRHHNIHRQQLVGSGQNIPTAAHLRLDQGEVFRCISEFPTTWEKTSRRNNSDRSNRLREEYTNENVMGQASVSFFEALQFEFCISGNDDKIRVFCQKKRDLQGFQCKKDPAGFLLQGLFLL